MEALTDIALYFAAGAGIGLAISLPGVGAAVLLNRGVRALVARIEGQRSATTSNPSGDGGG